MGTFILKKFVFVAVVKMFLFIFRSRSPLFNKTVQINTLVEGMKNINGKLF